MTTYEGALGGTAPLAATAGSAVPSECGIASPNGMASWNADA
jgi:hypothetical protein